MSRTFPEGSLSVTVYGHDWNDIKEEARRIACMPHGNVVMTYDMGGIYRKSDSQYYAYVTVIPATESELAAGTEYYSLDELKKSAVDILGSYGLGGTSSGAFLDKLALQVRKNRAFDANGGK